ncbi:hypothetical protein N0V93_003598 [Gnomoniopsis smithogilvyi]|uniref:BHLH domain-containing protein n=1 Tax=Gnomoniopsis smithogilvyi TaxID=1191159 RepID=A0A9W8YZ10_9PEZI|nr:hypothetical protein N0V93_003598 [Gnomoniopsis smithogilvyi]
MPRTALPPTPASSTDIHGKDGTKQLSSIQMSFELPEPAINNPNSAGSSHSGATFSPDSPVSTTSPKAPYPIQPAEAVKSRRRSSAAAAAAAAAAKESNNAFALPPPPTRSRKIIQMKPRLQQEEKKAAEAATPPAATTSGKASGRRTVAAAAATAAPAANETGSASKKKQPSATSAAGRKIARKTAHSLIERRRRSKMNEEFAVLKGMIPACTGEMHKLAILQASIEYVRYLQDCIEKLQSRDPQTPTEKDSLASSFRPQSYHAEEQYQSHEQAYEEEGEEQSPDVEMANSDITPSPTFTTRPSSSTALTQQQPSSHQASPSPALTAQDSAARRHDSYASISNAVEHHRHYSYSSATMSPAMGPGWSSAGGYAPSNPGSTLTSPALGPLRERDLDQEATAALLMLNSDRRGTVGNVADRGGSSANGRGMSVRDLLSA